MIPIRNLKDGFANNIKLFSQTDRILDRLKGIRIDAYCKIRFTGNIALKTAEEIDVFEIH